MDIIKSLKQLAGMDDPPAVSIDQRRAAAKAAIEGWLRTQTVTQYKLPPDRFAERLRTLVDSPHMLRQGAYPWCLPAAFLHSVLRRFPDEIVKFGLSLYSNGAGELGDIDVTLSEAFRAFDYPETIRSDQSLPARNRDLYLEAHADWLLLGALQDHTTSYPMSGSPHDPVNFSSSALADLFDDCDLYEDVTTLSLNTKRNRQDLLAELAKCQSQDVLLVGAMFRFGAPGSVDHAVRLVAPPAIAPNGNSGTAADKETMTFQFWSWGFQPSAVEGLPFDATQNEFTSQQTRHQFEVFDIIVAEPKPI